MKQQQQQQPPPTSGISIALGGKSDVDVRESV